MNDLIPEGRYLPMALPELGITAHWVLSPEGGAYLAVRKTCEELGVAHQRQIQKLDEDYMDDPAIWRTLRIETAGGRQPTNCLRKAEAALWIAGISPRKVKAELSGRIAEIRAAIIHAADRIVWGDYSGALTVSSTPARGGNLHVGGCPRCHTPLGLHAGTDGISLYVVENVE